MPTLFERTATEWIVGETAPSGAQIHQLTSCPAINDHEYFEVPYMDASSRYVFFTRYHDSVGTAALWRADLERRLVTQVAVARGRMRGHAVSPDHRFFYTIDLQEGGAYTLVRLDMVTLESDRWDFDGTLLPRTRGSVGRRRSHLPGAHGLRRRTQLPRRESHHLRRPAGFPAAVVGAWAGARSPGPSRLPMPGLSDP